MENRKKDNLDVRNRIVPQGSVSISVYLYKLYNCTQTTGSGKVNRQMITSHYDMQIYI